MEMMHVMQKSSDEAQLILSKGFDRFPWDDQDAYKGYLSQLHYYTRRSVRLLAEMLAHTDTSDPLYDYLINHIKEENGHEKIALKNLLSLGGSIEDYPELAETRELYESQFYKAARQPQVVLGYSHTLERLSIERAAWVADIVSSHGEHCDTFLRVHDQVDVDHCDAGDKQLNLVPSEYHSAICENMTQSALAYCNMLDAIKSMCEPSFSLISQADEWTPHYIKKVSAMIRLAISKDLLHERPNDWLSDCIRDGSARGLVEGNDLIGFAVLRKIGTDMVYGESTLWRHVKYWDVIRDMIAEQASELGCVLYGAFYKENQLAAQFYDETYGYDRIDPCDLPDVLHQELKGYFDEIQLIRLNFGESKPQLHLGRRTLAA